MKGHHWDLLAALGCLSLFGGLYAAYPPLVPIVGGLGTIGFSVWGASRCR